MSDRRPATTIGELDIHLWNVMQKLDEVQQKLETLATKSYVDEQVRLVNQRIHDNQPSTLLSNAAKIAAGFVAIAAFLGLLYEVAVTLHAVRSTIPAPAPVVKQGAAQ